MTTHQPGYYRDILESMYGHPTFHCGMSVPLKRELDHGDTTEVDTWINFDAKLTAKAFKGDQIDPPYGPEFEYTITDISLDLPPGQDPVTVGGPLTDNDKLTLTKWFEDHEHEAHTHAMDQYDRHGD